MDEDQQTQAAGAVDTVSAADESLLKTAPEPGADPGETILSPEEKGEAAGDGAILTPEKAEPENENLGAPESYTGFELPEGFELADADRTEAEALFKGMNLSQKGAQNLIDAYAKRLTAAKEAELNALADKRREWRESIRRRPNFAAERALALKGLNAVVGEPEEKALFTNSWMSDHPALFNMFVKVGRMIGEDSPLPRGGSGSGEPSNTERFPVKL